MDLPPNKFNFLFQQSAKSKSKSIQKDKNPKQQSQKLNDPQNNHNQRNNQIHQIPQTQFPTPQHPLQFYKCPQRLTSQMFSSRIGIRVRQFPRVQQDYICYLTQLLMTECSWIKIFIIEPNYLYIEMNCLAVQKESAISNFGDMGVENQRQEIVLENNIVRYLRIIREEFLQSFFDSYLDPNRLTSNQFNQDRLIEVFQKEVVEKIKQKYLEIFSKSKIKKN